MKTRYLMFAVFAAIPFYVDAQEPVVYTMQQAAAGRAAYEESCADGWLLRGP